MRKRIEKTDFEWELFKDVYKLYEDFRIPERTNEYWESLVAAGNELAKKYPNNILATKLIIGVMDALNELVNKGERDK